MTESPRSTHDVPRRSSNAWRWGAGLLVLLLGAFLVAFDWNWLREPLGSRVSAVLQHSFRIGGNLVVHPWSWTPTLVAEDVHLDNVGWGTEPDLFAARKVALGVDLRQLLHGNWVLSQVELDAPRLHLEESAEGQANWAHPTPDDRGHRKAVRIARLRIFDGQVKVSLPTRQTEIALTLDTAEEGADGARPDLTFAAEGRWRGSPIRLNGRAGSLLDLEDPNRPYPLAIEGTAGATRFTLDGTVTNLLALAGMDVNFSVAGRSLAELYRLVGVPMPATRPYRLTAHLTHGGGQWRFSGIDGRVGFSDLAGELSLDRNQKPQRLVANLRSRQLDLADLSGLVGARSDSGQPLKPRPGRILPDQPIDLQKLAAANVAVQFSGAHIITDGRIFEDVDVHARIEDGVVSLDPLHFGIAQGEVVSTLRMDTRKAPMEARLILRAARLRLRDLLPLDDPKRLTTGTLGGQAHLDMQGKSVASLLGSADGELSFAMSGGSTNRLLVRLADLDVINSLRAWLVGGPKEEIRCIVGTFQARDGVLETRSLVMDSEKMRIRGEGRIDLRDESLDLRLRAASKDLTPLALRGPLRLKGQLGSPSLGPDPLPLSGRVATAVGLGLLSPPLALLPLIEPGSTEEPGCGTLPQSPAGPAK